MLGLTTKRVDVVWEKSILNKNCWVSDTGSYFVKGLVLYGLQCAFADKTSVSPETNELNAKTWKQSYEENIVFKRTKSVLMSLTVH